MIALSWFRGTAPAEESPRPSFLNAVQTMVRTRELDPADCEERFLELLRRAAPKEP